MKLAERSATRRLEGMDALCAVRRHPATGLTETRWRSTATVANLPEAVRENEEVVPVNAVSTWVLPSGVTVGR